MPRNVEPVLMPAGLAPLPGYVSPSVGGSSMRYARRFSVSTRWRAGMLPLCAAFALGCHGEVGSVGSTDNTPLCAASDPGQLLAPQRVALLTSTQLMNMVGVVSTDPTVGDALSKMIIDGQLFPVITDLTVRYPLQQT